MRAIAIAVVALGLPAAAAAQPVQSKRIARDAKADITVAGNYLRDSRNENFYGFRLSAAKNLSETVAIVGEGGWARGARKLGVAQTQVNDADISALGGVRFRTIDGNVAPFFQLTAGLENRNDGATKTSRSSFAIRTDVGADMALTSRMALRATAGWTFLSASVPYQNEFGATLGLTWAVGKK